MLKHTEYFIILPPLWIFRKIQKLNYGNNTGQIYEGAFAKDAGGFSEI